MNPLELSKCCRCWLLCVLSECNKGSQERSAKTKGGHRLSVQTPGSRHQLRRVGHSQEPGHGLPALQTFSKTPPADHLSTESRHSLVTKWRGKVLRHEGVNLKMGMSSFLLQIVFQLGNLLQAKCNTSFVPQSITRFQGPSARWASTIDLGKEHSVCVTGTKIKYT